MCAGMRYKEEEEVVVVVVKDGWIVCLRMIPG